MENVLNHTFMYLGFQMILNLLLVVILIDCKLIFFVNNTPFPTVLKKTPLLRFTMKVKMAYVCMYILEPFSMGGGTRTDVVLVNVINIPNCFIMLVNSNKITLISSLLR